MNHWTASQACQRVTSSQLLKPLFDIICEYDWPNIQDHIDWVCTASEEDIFTWAESIRINELEAE